MTSGKRLGWVDQTSAVHGLLAFSALALRSVGKRTQADGWLQIVPRKRDGVSVLMPDGEATRDVVYEQIQGEEGHA